jgi:acyl-CoA reductase-like NAD-dependent aldehyde dehydrogenase
MPTILTNCTPGYGDPERVYSGPVAAIVRVPDFNTAIAMANDSEFGLGATAHRSGRGA